MPTTFSDQEIADQLTRDGNYWYGDNGDNTIYYSFTSDLGDSWAGIAGEFQLDAIQQLAINIAFDHIESIFNINFTEISPPNNYGESPPFDIIQIANAAGYGTFSSSYMYQDGGIIANAVILDSTWATNASANLSAGSYGYTTILHELLHSLGLDHPGDYTPINGQDVTYSNNAGFTQDTGRYSVMSYFGAHEDGSGANHFDTVTGTISNPRTLMVYDILAMTSGDFNNNFGGYSLNTTTRNTDTVYGYNITPGTDPVYDFAAYPAPVLTIYDAGGIDTLDLSGDTVANTSTLTYDTDGNITNVATSTRTETHIDIREGEYSSTHGMVYNIGIAFGTVIENVVGTIFDDTIVGNDADNNLDGGSAGSDTIYGGIGNDALFGGSENDTIFGEDDNDYLDGGTGSDTLSGGNGDDTILYDANDTLANISGGLGFDTLLFEAVWISIDLASYGFEQSALLILDTANELWESIYSYFNLAEDLTSKQTNYDDGTYELIVYDHDDSETWSEWVRNYDEFGVLTSESFIGDITGPINGTNADDNLPGTADSDTINGLDGADIISGGDENDILNGGNGNDSLFGGNGADILNGNADNDTLDGGLGIDQLFGGDGDDRIIYDSIDSTINGGADTDTLVIDGALPVGFDLSANDFEFAEQLVHNATNEQVNTYNSSWQLVSREYTYTNSNTTKTVWDVANTQSWQFQITYTDHANLQSWTSYTDSYNDQNQIYERSYLDDDGNSHTTNWDLANTQTWDKSIEYTDGSLSRNWSKYTDYYDDQNRITERSYELDNSDTNITIWDYEGTQTWAKSIQYGDGLQTRGWETYTDYYDDQNRIVERSYDLDNNDATKTIWDVEGEQDWAYQQIFIDGLGTRSYSQFSKSYDSLNRLITYDIELDNGDSTSRLFDFDNSQDWSNKLTYNDGLGTRNWEYYTETFNDAGQLSEKLYVFDNGNQTIQTWDLENTESWHRQDRQLDTSDLYTWSERIFEYDEFGGLLNSTVIEDEII